jgi:RNA polymerase sigma-70 factor (TIGR02960 family)
VTGEHQPSARSREAGAGPASDRVGGIPFDDLVTSHRRELHAHCYRMTGSVVDADDLVQETFVRAWRSRDRFEGRSSVRTWLYRIATNVCLDSLGRRGRRATPVGDLLAEDVALQPYPDGLLAPGVGGAGAVGPDDRAVARETIELGLIAALLHLPGRQRAALVLRDLLGWTPTEVADVLGVSVAAANSLTQRARATLAGRVPGDRATWERPELTTTDQAVLDRYIRAHEQGDATTILGLLRDDVRITMPPEPPAVGLADATTFLRSVIDPAIRPGDWRMVPTRANGRPAAANYLRRPGDDRFRALSVDVLTLDRSGRISEINCFLDEALFRVFGLPLVDGAEAGS